MPSRASAWLLYFGARMAHQAFGQAWAKLNKLSDVSVFYVGNRPTVVVQGPELQILSTSQKRDYLSFVTFGQVCVNAIF